jgi:hypothetical protein
MGAGAVIVVMILLGVIAFLSVVGYKWNQCKNRDGKSSNVASYVFSFPFSCSANTCVSGFTLDKSGNCVASATTSSWTDNTVMNGLDYMTFQNSSLSICQSNCMADANCDSASFDKLKSKCMLHSQKKNPSNYCTMSDTNFQTFQKPGGAIPSKC